MRTSSRAASTSKQSLTKCATPTMLRCHMNSTMCFIACFHGPPLLGPPAKLSAVRCHYPATANTETSSYQDHSPYISKLNFVP